MRIPLFGRRNGVELPRWVAGAAATAMAAILIAACQEVTPAPDPPQPTKPTLLGTWERVTDWVDDDGDVVTSTTRLVFSESGKAFRHETQFDLFGEDRHSPYGEIADWSATDDTITKTFLYDDDGDDQWDSGTVDKLYYFDNSGMVLFVHHWESRRTEDVFDRYTRVLDPVPSNPTLLGTWESEAGYWEYDDLLDRHVLVSKLKRTLTFTENRYIIYNWAETGNNWHHSGTWAATDSSISKTAVAVRQYDDDGNVTIESRSFDKQYAWGAGGELFVMGWGGEDEDAVDAVRPEIERFTRVEHPLPPFVGVWLSESERELDDGQTQVDRTTLTIGEEFTWSFDREVGGQVVLSWSVSGSLRHDASKLFLLVDVQDAVRTNQERFPDWSAQFIGHELRLAYAPTGVPGEIAISWWHWERSYDPDTNTWSAESEVYPYGRYAWRPFVKQP